METLEKACRLKIDVFKKPVCSEQSVNDGGWKGGVNWTKLCEGFEGVLSDESFAELPLAREYS